MRAWVRAYVIVRVLFEFMCAYIKLDKYAEAESNCTMVGRTDLHACMGACVIVRVLWAFMFAYIKLDKHAEVESDCTMVDRTYLHACMGAYMSLLGCCGS